VTLPGALFILSVCLTVNVDGGEIRVFTNDKGNTLEAEFISGDDDEITVRRISDKMIFFIPTDTLSEKDREWIKQQTQSFEGVWGGKWDDTWPVFLIVKKGSSENQYSVTYTWRENRGRPLRSEDKEGKDEGGYIHSGSLFFKTSGKTGMLYGKFSRPRMANLVLIDDADVDLENVELETHGWKPGVIPAGEAYVEITGEKADQ